MKKYKLSQRNYKLICESLHTSIFAHSENKLQKSRQGQITIFIILGLVLLLSVGLVLYLSQKKEMQKEPVIDVPAEERPINDFVTTCFTQMAKEAVVKLGMQGGYLQIPREMTRTPTAYLSLDPMNILKLPYWYYEGEDRTPTLQDMENQISTYLEDNAKNCESMLDQFEPTTVQQIEPAKVQTILTDEDIAIKIKWPLEIKFADRTKTRKDYALRLPVRLKQMWEVADATMKTENKLSFFENRTIDFMSADENIPTDGMVIECGPKKWFLPDVQKELQTLLQYNLPYVRIENTNYLPFADKTSTYKDLAKARNKMMANLENGVSLDKQTPPSNIPEDAYMYFKMTMDTGIAPSDLKATFSYQPEWGMMMTAEPHEGQMLKTNLGKGARKFLPFLCINQWHFAYDIIYPIKLTIKDDKAFLNKGYTFQIAFPVLINSNAPERVFFGIQKFRQPAYLEEFCAATGDTIADVRAKGFVEEMPIATELPDVNITYTCFNQYCELGKTKADEGYYRLRAPLPQGCNNPIITAAKDGYLPASSVYRGDKLELQMTKLKKMNVEVKVHPYNLDDQQYAAPTTLQEKQKISLHIFLRNSTFDQYKQYPQDNQIELAAGKASYDIDALLTDNDNLIGGYIGQAINITYADIADKNTIVLNVIEIKPHPISDHKKELGEAAQFLYSNEDYQKALKPEFK